MSIYVEDWLFIRYTYFDTHGAEQSWSPSWPISTTLNHDPSKSAEDVIQENIINWPKDFFQACEKLLTQILIIDNGNKNWGKKDVQIIFNKEPRISPCTLAYNWQSNLVETLTRNERRAFHLAFAKLVIKEKD